MDDNDEWWQTIMMKDDRNNDEGWQTIMMKDDGWWWWSDDRQ